MSELPPVEEFIQAFAKICEEYEKLASKFFRGSRRHPYLGIINLWRVNLTYQKILLQAFANLYTKPELVFTTCLQFFAENMQLCQAIAEQIASEKPAEIIAPELRDRRFRHPFWKMLPAFNYIKQWYLLFGRRLTAMIAELDDLGEIADRQINFCIRVLLETIAPTNYWLSNPEIQKATVDSGGLNLLKGLGNYLEDLNLWHGYLNLKKTELNAFIIGDNIATTPGKVVFQNDIMQLIQYAPLTANVRQVPILVVTSWINKYYILDLTEKNSLVRAIVAEGFTVFIISWVNPDERHANKGFEDYLQEGTVTAIDVIAKITKEPKVNVLGFCLGGTLLACTAAYLAARGDDRISSITLLATLIDFADPGDIGDVTGDDQIQVFEHSMQEFGYWDGRKMVTCFNMLQTDAFIWPYFINQYLRGNQPLPLDSLYWTLDFTNSPAPLYSFYLKSMLRNNSLITGDIKFNGMALDFRKISAPAYFVAMQHDHICPWRSSYAGSQLLQGEVTFNVVDAGHVAGVINPPTRNKYSYFTAKANGLDAQQFAKQAKTLKGSWWPQWYLWVTGHSGEKIPARVPGNSVFKPLDDAPGSYVKDRLIDRDD